LQEGRKEGRKEGDGGMVKGGRKATEGRKEGEERKRKERSITSGSSTAGSTSRHSSFFQREREEGRKERREGGLKDVL
jgi:hypothetical protein